MAPDQHGNFKGITVPSSAPWPPDHDEPVERCEGDGYLDIVDHETGGVIGPRPCPGCPDCRSTSGPGWPE